MSTAFVSIGALLSAAVLSAAVLSAGPAPAEGPGSQSGPLPFVDAGTLEQSREGGSAVPCAVPLRWRVTRVDRGFGVTVREAAQRVGEAAAVWNDAVGGTLFVRDETEGFPIRLVFDGRQERLRERARREAALAEAGAGLDEERAELERRVDVFERGQAEHGRRAGAYEERLARHNATVRRWNERGGAPGDVARELEEAGRGLEEDRRDLERVRVALESDRAALERDVQRLDRDVAEHAERSLALARDFPPTPVQSGEYREAVRRENGRLVSVSREIRIYRFADADDLRLVAAHELGHALGLGHSPVDGAVMSERHTRTDGEPVVRRPQADDRRRLRALCPGLGDGAP